MSPVLIGLFGVLIVCFAQAFALPLIRKIKLSSEWLLVIRGSVTLVLACLGLLITNSPILTPNWWLTPAAISFGLAALCLFRAVKAWGGARSLVVVAVTPIINLAFHRNESNATSFIALVGMFVGICLALEPWRKGSNFSVTGLWWSLFGTCFNALFYEASTGVNSPPIVPTVTVCFCQGLAVAFVGLIGAKLLKQNSQATEQVAISPWLLLAFGAIGGFAYFWGNQLAFANLSTVSSSILLQLEVVIVAVAEAIIDPKMRLNSRQWIGTIITLAATAYLAIQLAGAQ